MKEKFSDFESEQYLSETGEFEFEITEYELKQSSKGNPMAVFKVKSDAGSSTLYHSLASNCRWSYNNLIKACLNMTQSQIKTFELDYETFGQELVGKHFIGVVEEDSYQKAVKVPQDDGTFIDDVETKISYKITSYKSCADSGNLPF